MERTPTTTRIPTTDAAMRGVPVPSDRRVSEQGRGPDADQAGDDRGQRGLVVVVTDVEIEEDGHAGDAASCPAEPQ